MLEAEIDVFSGIPNPSFQLSEKEERELLDRIMADPGQLSPLLHPSEHFGLGYRGVVIRLVKTDSGPWWKAQRPSDLVITDGLTAPPGRLPLEFRLGSRPAAGESAASWLLTIAERRQLAITDEVRQALQGGVRLLGSPPEERPPETDTYGFGVGETEPAPRGATWWACNSPSYANNAWIFNLPDVVTRNNCYCFASNVVANIRYALPGRRGGRPAMQPYTCGSVIDGLRADGWIDGCQVNTLTIALVIWPNTDYHFYRVVTGGPDWWWAHKPGGTPARSTDESNRNLFRGRGPENCNPGPYVHFCGYFYQNNSTAFVA